MMYYRIECTFGTFYICVLPGHKIWPIVNQVSKERNLFPLKTWKAYPLNRGDIPRDETIHCINQEHDNVQNVPLNT